MDNESIKKINKIGKVAYIITRIIRVLLVIAFVVMIGFTLATIALPKDIFGVRITGEAQVIINKDSLSAVVGEKSANKILDDINEDSFKIDINNAKYSIVGIDKNAGETIINTKTEFSKANVRTGTIVLVGIIIKIIIVYVLMTFVSDMCRAFEQCTGLFEKTLLLSVRKVTIAIIPFVIINAISNVVMKVGITKRVDMTVVVNSSTLLIIVLSLVLSYVLKHGVVISGEEEGKA